MNNATVRRPESGELTTVAAAYNHANANDPVLCWIIPDEDARGQMMSSTEQTAAWMRAMLRTGDVAIAADTADRVLGVSLWEFVEGGDSSSHLGSEEHLAVIDSAYGPYAPRMKELTTLALERRPLQERHWYLEQIVVAPDQRGAGIGGALLRHHLARIDAEGLPAYLEASDPRNQVFYERHGFRPVGDPIELPDDGPRLQPMWRDAQG